MTVVSLMRCLGSSEREWNCLVYKND